MRSAQPHIIAHDMGVWLFPVHTPGTKKGGWDLEQTVHLQPLLLHNVLYCVQLSSSCSWLHTPHGPPQHAICAVHALERGYESP